VQIANNQYSFDIYNSSGKRLNFYSTGLSTESNFLNEVEIYPNPVSDILNISSTLELKKIEIFQMNGQKVVENTGQFTSIDMSKMAVGV
jgi:hypothetical protein